MKHVNELASNFSESRNKLTNEVQDMVQRASDPGHLADLLATQLLSDTVKRQDLLEQADPLHRLDRVAGLIQSRSRHRRAGAADQGSRSRSDRQEPARVLPARAAEGHPRRARRRGRQRDRGARAKIAERGMPRRCRREAAARGRPPGTDARRLRRSDRRAHLPRHGAEPALDEQSDDQLDLDEAEQILDEDHYGLEQVKERILEFLAVRKLKQRTEAATARRRSSASSARRASARPASAARSPARWAASSCASASAACATRPRFAATAAPTSARCPAASSRRMKQAGTINPVILLDEIDKLSSDYPRRPGVGAAGGARPGAEPRLRRPLPRHAVRPLEGALHHHRQLARARSRARCATAWRSSRSAATPRTRRSRSAERYLLPKQLDGARADAESARDPATSVWARLVRDYTREAGVRELERQIATLCRKVGARGRARQGRASVRLTDQTAGGVPRAAALRLRGQQLGRTQIGLAIGLGATEVGGELHPGRGRDDAGQGRPDDHRSGRRRDAGVGPGRALLRPLPAQHLQIDPDFQRANRSAHPPAGGRAAEGRPVGRHHYGHRAYLGADRRPVRAIRR